MTNPNKLSAIEKTQQIFTLLDQWGISTEEKIKLLNLQNYIKARHLSRYRHGESLPDVGDVQLRIEHLLGIADALRTMHPHNSQMAAIWVKQFHRRFKERTPLQTMLEDDLQGIILVRRELDCTFDWQL